MKAKSKEKSKDFAKIVFAESDAIIIPEGMPIETASSLLSQEWAKTDRRVSFTEVFSVIPFEGAAALQTALESLYSDVWKGEDALMINLEVDVGKTVTIPWGQFKVPGVEGHFETEMAMNDAGALVFRLNAEIKRKHESHFHQLVKKMRAILAKGKLYKGKAFQIQFRDSDGDTVRFLSPKLLDVSDAAMPIFNEGTKHRLEVEVFDILKKAKLMKKFEIPLKKGILLAATYGMGKTLVGRYIAKVTIESGWTYIYVPSAAELPEAYMLAREYMPALVFVEDINRVVGSNRTAQVDRILNILDGVGTKDDEIVVLMTTNEPEQIHPALLRPGRVDSIIRIDPYDAQTIEQLLRYYAGELLIDNCNLSKVSRKLEGQTGARIAHVVKTAKQYALHHLVGDKLQITEGDLLKAAEATILEAQRVEDEHQQASIPFPVALAVMLSSMGANMDVSMMSMPHPNGKKETFH